jgi:hypothetical protein
MLVECYAQRLLNPFRGAMHTIRCAAAEAVTVDGRHWDLYVSDDALLSDLDRARHTQVGDIRYGSWSAETGLRRGPRNPSEDFRRMEALGDVVARQLLSLHHRIPFIFKDDLELWLLDTAHRPLALLDSVLAEDEMTLDRPLAWRAGFAARERFASPALRALTDDAATAGDYLTGYVNACAGTAPAAQWFRRHADGSGTGLAGIGLPHRCAGRRLDAEEFPALLLADCGHDAAHRQLIDDFHAWQAVWLLVLPCLDHERRRALERQVRCQSLLVDGQFRLYPEIIDADVITAARVEAALRRSAQPLPEADDSLPTFYIELNPGGNE